MNPFKILLLVAVVGLFSCSETKKIRKAKSKLDEHPLESARYCADKYKVDTTFIAGDTITEVRVLMDTSYINVECLPDSVKVIVRVPVAGKTVYETKYIHDTLKLRDNAAEMQYKLQAEQSNDTANKALTSQAKTEKGRDKWRIIALCALGALAVIGIFKIKGLLTPSIKTIA